MGVHLNGAVTHHAHTLIRICVQSSRRPFAALLYWTLLIRGPDSLATPEHSRIVTEELMIMLSQPRCGGPLLMPSASEDSMDFVLHKTCTCRGATQIAVDTWEIVGDKICI
ncbi:hypothetical protein ARMSODRAFT_956268 [Armillaria solidipes]|uniref:Uncharacterized protein n=1 Tax=Armillaria solidipes TaxID=1076256 RepID=A0A2H3BKI3_9AGAR|nr:hypothetical protein ARMSODRAFT_956268 [Armillaria solidipes]